MVYINAPPHQRHTCYIAQFTSQPSWHVTSLLSIPKSCIFFHISIPLSYPPDSDAITLASFLPVPFVLRSCSPTLLADLAPYADTYWPGSDGVILQSHAQLRNTVTSLFLKLQAPTSFREPRKKSPKKINISPSICFFPFSTSDITTTHSKCVAFW